MGKPKAYPSIAAAALLLLLCFVAEGKKLKTFSESYQDFKETTYDGILVGEGSATINADALQVTVDTVNTDVIKNASGRFLLRKRFRLWEGGNNSTRPRQASFNASFLVNIFPTNGTPGEGLAFVIVPALGALPLNSSGQYLGLTNASTDGNSTNKLIAVELDTVQQDFDPDDNHIGLNVNGVRSVQAKPLAPYNIILASDPGRFYNVWVDYDGENRRIQVYIAEQLEKLGATPPKPSEPILSDDLNLTDHVNQDSYFGFAASTGTTVQLNCVLRWNLTVLHFDDDPNWLAIGLGAGIPAAVLLVLGAVGLWYYWRKRRAAFSNPNLSGALRSLPGTPREFEFKD